MASRTELGANTLKESMKQIEHEGKLLNRYVTEDGRVFKGNGEECVPSNNGNGYLTVHLFSIYIPNKKSKSKREYIHRLVAKAFLPNLDNLPQVNHKDSDKSNNAVENLEWSSGSHNIKHSHANGNMQKRYEVGAVEPLTEGEVVDCYTRVKNGEKITHVAASIGRARTTLSSIMNKRSRVDITDKLDKMLNCPK